ncbi:hypothetical protein [Paenibacillus sp. PL2-23]
MPFNKSEKIHNQQNEARQQSKAITPKAEKMADRAASLNGINKENM